MGGVYCCCLCLIKCLMLCCQWFNQCIVLVGLLGGWELNVVGDKVYLCFLLSDKIFNLNQLLGKDLCGWDQWLQCVGWCCYYFGVNLIEDWFEIVSLFQCVMCGIGLYFCILQLLVEYVQCVVCLMQWFMLGYIILWDVDCIDVVYYWVQISVYCLVYLL